MSGDGESSLNMNAYFDSLNRFAVCRIYVSLPTEGVVALFVPRKFSTEEVLRRFSIYVLDTLLILIVVTGN